VEPSPIGTAFVISTPELLNFISEEHDFASCAQEHIDKAHNAAATIQRKRE
jgi:hypothetical protein